MSLSARRAWIEITPPKECSNPGGVALRKESVDRNFPGTNIILFTTASLSARRAWIEILNSIKRLAMSVGRSPQGERG